MIMASLNLTTAKDFLKACENKDVETILFLLAEGFNAAIENSSVKTNESNQTDKRL